MDESLLEGIPPSQASGDFPRQTSSCDPALCYSSISPDQATPLKWSIPSDQFPDDLLVHDNSALKSFTTTHYARVYPVFPRDSCERSEHSPVRASHSHFPGTNTYKFYAALP